MIKDIVAAFSELHAASQDPAIDRLVTASLNFEKISKCVHGPTHNWSAAEQVVANIISSFCSASAFSTNHLITYRALLARFASQVAVVPLNQEKENDQ